MKFEVGTIFENTLEIIGFKYDEKNNLFYECKCLKCEKIFYRNCKNISKNKKMCKECSSNLWKENILNKEFKFAKTTNDKNKIFKIKNKWYVECLCKCGNIFNTRVDNLNRKGYELNCGCISNKNRKNALIESKYKATTTDENRLFYLHPNFKKEYDFDKNINIDPYYLSEHSNKNIWWKCEKGHSYKRSPITKIKSPLCPYCTFKKFKPTYNDLWTIRKDIREEIVDTEKAKVVSAKSNKDKILCKCKDCGTMKYITPYKMSIYDGINCEVCKDGISYGEKYIINLLKQLNIEYICQKEFYWLKNKRYDFYIPNKNTIIEVNGLQHYEECKFFNRSLDEEKENDKLKEDYATNNNILHYIKIPYSSKYDIMNNILSSDLINILNLDNVDFKKCSEFANKNICMEIIKYFNENNCGSKKIQKYFTYVSVGTIENYLKIGKSLNLCNYNKYNKTFNCPIKVLYTNNNIIYSSINKCCKDLNIQNSLFTKHINNGEKEFNIKQYRFKLVE